MDRRSVVPREPGQERGFVLVFFSISLLGLVLLMGFAVDLGSWYLNATRLQRAADVASLSAAVALPDPDAAVASANDSLKRNGFVDGQKSIKTSITAGSDSVSVNVKNTAVATHFVRMLFPTITISRTARAQKAESLPLGNPFNVFGYGNNLLKLTGSVPPQGFWGAINGPCDPKEDGDFFQARRDGNKLPDRHVCGLPDGTNPHFNAGGYSYLVEVPPGVNNVTIRVFDPMYAISTGGTRGDLRTAIGNEGGGFDTTFAVTKVIGSSPSKSDPNVGLTNGTRFAASNPIMPPGATEYCWSCWYPLAEGLGPGTYRVNVAGYWKEPHHNAQQWSGQATGFNSYAIMASEASKLNVACDSRALPSCPRVSGYGAVSAYNNGSSTAASYYLAEIDPGLAGSQLTAYLWDPGEGMESLELLAPDGSNVQFMYTVSPASGSETGGGPTTVLLVGGDAPPPAPNRQGTGKYNDRLVTLHFTAPKYTPVNNDKWFKLRYKSGTANVTDRITYGVGASASSPVHLANAAG